MKISELMINLQNTLSTFEDVDVCISIDESNKHSSSKIVDITTTKNLTTLVDQVEKGVFEFRISNWML